MKTVSAFHSYIHVYERTCICICVSVHDVENQLQLLSRL